MKTIIFANGELHHPNQIRRLTRHADFLIASDGGLRHMRALGLVPNLVIGDMDSIDQSEAAQLAQDGVEVITYPQKKDHTDLELALMAAVDRGGNPILLVAALGGRLDLTISNIMLLAHPDLADIDVRIEDGQDELFFIQKYGQVRGTIGDRVSLLALNGPAEGIRTVGLQYPLQEEALYAKQARGVSNVLVEMRAEIWVRQGMLLCIHTRSENETQGKKGVLK